MYEYSIALYVSYNKSSIRMQYLNHFIAWIIFQIFISLTNFTYACGQKNPGLNRESESLSELVNKWLSCINNYLAIFVQLYMGLTCPAQSVYRMTRLMFDYSITGVKLGQQTAHGSPYIIVMLIVLANIIMTYGPLVGQTLPAIRLEAIRTLSGSYIL